MASNDPLYRRLPAYKAFIHPPSLQHGILEIYDFYSSCSDSFPSNGSGAAERTNLQMNQLRPRTGNTKLRWITLQNNSSVTLKYLVSEDASASELQSTDPHEKSIFERSYLRFGRFRYSQVYAESSCECIVPETGYSPTGSARLDPQLAIYLPYFKWDPTSRSVSDGYPSLRDYAQPSIFHDAHEHEIKTRSSPHSLPFVVHQLWLFVTGSRTIVSYHPAAAAHSGGQLDVDLNAALMADIPGLTSKDAKDTDPIMDAYIMAACLARQACLLQLQGPMVKTPMFHFLEEKVADLSGKRINAYTSFSDSISDKASDKIIDDGRHSDMRLLLEIIMTIEELQSFDFVLDSQEKVMTQMKQAYLDMEQNWNTSEKALPLLTKTLNDLRRIKTDVARLIKNTAQIQAAMAQLLDLKQKEANLLESQYARLRAEEAVVQTRQSAQQGRTLLLFTVMTIMFLPLSFFTSYFGMNVQDITGDNQNTTTQRVFWTVCAPITVTVVTVAVLIAFNESVRDTVKRLSQQLSN